MADPKRETDQRVKHSVRRTLARLSLFLVLLAGIVGWGYFGYFTLKPGQAAVLLLLGGHYKTIMSDGPQWTLPPPLVTRAIVNYDELRNIDFGFRGKEDASTPKERMTKRLS